MPNMFRNIFANYLGAGAIVLAPILALPFYLVLLGPKQFGLVSFVATLQGFLSLLDSGLSQISLREFSVRMNGNQADRRLAALLLYGLERIYWLIGVAAACIMLMSSGRIAERWLVLDADATLLGLEAIWGAAVIFMVQFPGSLYRSFIIGSQAQVGLNVISVGSLAFRHGGAVALLFVRPELSTYLVWHAFSAVIETTMRNRYAWRKLGVSRKELTWNSALLQPLGFDVIKMAGAVFLGSLTTQMDKIILIRMVPIEIFGYYATAATVAQGVLYLITPLVQAISPHVMKANDDPRILRSLNLQLARYIGIAVAIGAICYLVAGEWMLGVWLRKADAVAVVYPLISVLLIGSALNAFYHIGYFTWLGQGKVRRIVVVNALSLVIWVLLVPPMVASKGVIGATFGFVAVNTLGLFVSLEWLKPIERRDDTSGAGT